MSDQLADELRNIERVLNDGDGFWKSCSGCHETVDGAPLKGSVYSGIFKCHLGSGCSECGGIGAIWDNNKYWSWRESVFDDLEDGATHNAMPEVEI